MTVSSTTAPLGAVDETAFRGSLAGVRGLHQHIPRKQYR
jgi:hypothetical protein